MTVKQVRETLDKLEEKGQISQDTEVRLGTYGGGSQSSEGIYVDDEDSSCETQIVVIH